MTIKDGKIVQFKDDERWLSNFAHARVTLDGVTYPTVENAYQAAKTLNPLERVKFTTCSSSEAKGLGKKLPLRSDWDEVKDSIMENLLRQKFAYPNYQKLLIETGEMIIEEGNFWSDTYWGIDLRTGKGQNKLGKMIMQIRKELTTEPEEEIINPTVAARFETPVDFLDKLVPFEDLAPQIGKMIKVVNTKPNHLPQGSAVLDLSRFAPRKSSRFEYREELRRCYAKNLHDAKETLTYFANILIECKQDVVYISVPHLEEDYVPLEIRRALVGVIMRQIKEYT